jgi:hypothetical protein
MRNEDWVSIEEDLPPEKLKVWVTNGKAQFESRLWYGKWLNGSGITHWMYLPTFPKE